MQSPRFLRRGLMLALFFALPGCVTTLPWTLSHEAPANVCQVHTFWDSRIQVTQDVANGGRSMPGFAGRLFLMGTEFGYPQKGDGSIAVDLYDVTNVAPGAAPKYLERWELDPVSVEKLLRHDKIGWGYTLFLPWSTYNPEIAKVQLSVCFIPTKGNPVYAEPTTISLRNQVATMQKREVVGQTGAGAPNAAATTAATAARPQRGERDL